METKKSKPTRITKMDKKDDYGNTSFVIDFENSDNGYFRTKNENQNSFVVGVEVEYTIEEKDGKNGKKYFTIKLPQKENNWKGNGRPQQDPKVNVIGYAMSYTKDLIVADKIAIKDIESTFDKIYDKMISKL